MSAQHTIRRQANELACASKAGHFADWFPNTSTVRHSSLSHPRRHPSEGGIHPLGPSNAVLQFKWLTDPVSYEKLKKVDSVECGSTLPLPRCDHFDIVTGQHKSILGSRPRKDDQYWITQAGTTSKAASAAGPPSGIVFNSVTGLTQQFEQLSVKKDSSTSANTGLIPGNARAFGTITQLTDLKHDEISMEPYSGCAGSVRSSSTKSNLVASSFGKISFQHRNKTVGELVHPRTPALRESNSGRCARSSCRSKIPLFIRRMSRYRRQSW